MSITWQPVRAMARKEWWHLLRDWRSLALVLWTEVMALLTILLVLYRLTLVQLGRLGLLP